MHRSASHGAALAEQQGSGLLRLVAAAKHKLHVPLGFGGAGGDVERAGSGGPHLDRTASAEEEAGARGREAGTRRAGGEGGSGGGVPCARHTRRLGLPAPPPPHPDFTTPGLAAAVGEAADFVVGLHQTQEHPDRWYILRGCSGSVHGGQVVGLLGPSGEPPAASWPRQQLQGAALRRAALRCAAPGAPLAAPTQAGRGRGRWRM